MCTRLFLNGCSGRMGRVICEIAASADDLSIVAGSDLQIEPAAFPIYADPRDCREEFDVVVDFSNPSALPRLFALIRERRCPAVICTTGLDAVLKEELQQLSAVAPIFQSANMSLGINLLISLVRQSASLLYPEFDIEIIEAHHNQKLDAPSGTALMIADQINAELDHKMTFIHDRSQVRQKRKRQEIGIHAIRGGSIVGEHTVLFAGQDELVTLHHSAQSRNVFARGALAAARFMVGRPAGLYSMQDLIRS
ncbi:MAG TPA: 4-hydroxy-tetrahydrodipicolinate reductase [Clostridiales bacterium]|nr:4-hydroxy-tetrahydrodipicolinate reductase [Clostridiales bacterium]